MRLHLAVITILLLSPTSGTVAAEDGGERITLERAHHLALSNAPSVSLARLKALEATCAAAMARSAYLPSLSGSATLARADSDQTRIAAGYINNPSVYDREAIGLMATQLITDFGKTSNAIAAATDRAQAEQKGSQDVVERVILDVDIMYFRTLQSICRVAVASKMLENRQLLSQRIAGLVANNLKSDLDLSYATVGLEETRMEVAQYENERRTNELTLATLLGFDAPQPFTLVDPDLVPLPTESDESLVAKAQRINPAIVRLRLEVDAAMHDLNSEQALDYPTISAIAVAGRAFDHDGRLPDGYAAGAINLSVPIYTGGRISADQHLADVKMRMAQTALHGAEDAIAREVRVAIANVRYAFARHQMSIKLADIAGQALTLARSRYELGLVSVIELSEAELNKTNADMVHGTSREEYLIQCSILQTRIGQGTTDTRINDGDAWPVPSR